MNLTDEESRIMKAPGGGFEQAYNAQALTDVHTKLIVGAFVTQHPIDVQQIEPALADMGNLPAKLDMPEHPVANTELQRRECAPLREASITPLIDVKREQHHP